MSERKSDVEIAPIAVFAYNRPEHLRRTLDSLVSCDGFGEGPVTVFIDGPRSAEETGAVGEVRQVAADMLGAHADIRISETNRGLSASITGGVNEQLDLHGRVIVIEDDLELSPNFLRFMTAALSQYADDPRVFQVSGHMFDVPAFAARQDAMFLPLTTTWGWGTWARSWKAYDPAASGWERLVVDRTLRRRFNLNGNYDYLRLMKRQARGQSDSWGIRWYWSVFQRDGLCLFPPQSLVHNTGQDGSGSHGGGIFADFSINENSSQGPVKLPEEISVSQADWDEVKKAVWKQNGRWLGCAKAKMLGWLGS